MTDSRRDEPVRLTHIYTRAGDGGETSLGDGTRVRKTDPLIAAIGSLDELNAAIGLALASALPERLRLPLEQAQNELFDLGADLSVPPAEGERERLRVGPERVEALEHLCDELSPLVAVYLNRLSDLLFILARVAAGGAERLWRPGA
jgi:cob(I)alamin adenosyltransferase